MNQRKLIKLGNSSFAIALPKTWVDKSGLKKGDNIFLEENGNGEIIVTSSFNNGRGNGKEAVITLGNKNEEEIARDLISSYVEGAGKIVLNGEKNKLKLVKELAKKFVNLEVIEETKEQIILKDLLDMSDISIERFLRRMDNDIKEMFNILQEALNDKKKVKKSVKEMEEIDKDVTKFYFLIWRFMNLGIDNPSVQSHFKLNSKNLVSFFWIAYNIEKIGDELKRGVRDIEKIKGNEEVLIKIFKKINDSYNKVMKSFFNKEKKSAKEIILKKGEMFDSCSNLSKIKGLEIISEKCRQIIEAIHTNAKMIFYSF